MSKETKKFPRRFYKSVEASEKNGLFHLSLDGRPTRTPGRKVLAVRYQAIAEAMVTEWSSQEDVIDPFSMPVTRLVNSAIDAVSNQMHETQQDIAGYADSDLVCYRASSPDGLAERQRAAWDPPLAWVGKTLGARFILTEGVMHVSQPPTTLAAVSKRVEAFRDPIALTGLHMATSLTGSVVLALALAEGQMSEDEIWTAAHVDEDWNIKMWGEDAEAAALRAHKLRDFRSASLVLAAIPSEK